VASNVSWHRAGAKTFSSTIAVLKALMTHQYAQMGMTMRHEHAPLSA